MNPVITAFEASPDRGRGLARDMPVRWAFEEVGQPYDVRLVSFGAMKAPAHRVLQPFGQIPTYERDGLTLFESGAIVLHIAENHPGLLSANADSRARAIAWMFAAASSVEPAVVDREIAWFTERDRPWYAERLTAIERRIRDRLDVLNAALGEAGWLDDEFSAGDLMMVTVLRRLTGSGLLDAYPSLSAYVACAEARPAFRRAFDAQYAVFMAASPD